MSAPALVVVNGQAGSGLALRQWPQIEAILGEAPGDLQVLMTHSVAEMAPQVQAAWEAGTRRVIAVGGDGTVHHLLETLVPLAQRDADGPPLELGILPGGTGNAWARSHGLPLSLTKAARQLIGARPTPVDLPEVTLDGRRRYFLSISSAGISGEIAQKSDVPGKRPWSYAQNAIGSLLQRRPLTMRVEVDGELWVDGEYWLVAVANCNSFGSGMRIAPDARVDDGLFDIVLIDGASRREVLVAFPRVYFGAHTSHPRVHIRRGSEVRVSGENLGMETDGVPGLADELRYSLQPGGLQLLVHPDEFCAARSS
ncbi:MAG: diacylglycerol kinase family lipid kinase [Anaerolineaceae bacterium]|nr:diacylglycerol kinase family lipid kinase [Anaerolineaceae bacterium]MDE0329110.1 diacylglycerol kinase family lipid kinase [Anaerolineaceae bacterium]